MIRAGVFAENQERQQPERQQHAAERVHLEQIGQPREKAARREQEKKRNRFHEQERVAVAESDEEDKQRVADDVARFEAALIQAA